MPSWLKPVAVGGSELSFEEERHRYMFSGRERGRKSLKEIQRMSISERKLEILDILLSTDEIRPIVMKLVRSMRVCMCIHVHVKNHVQVHISTFACTTCTCTCTCTCTYTCLYVIACSIPHNIQM